MRDARGAVHIQTNITRFCTQRLTCVKTHPNSDDRSLGPGVASEHSLCLDSGRDSISGSYKRDETRIALSVNFMSTESLEDYVEQPTMVCEDTCVAVA
jgi:hypothetical protein